jgi:hypothetical protein
LLVALGHNLGALGPGEEVHNIHDSILMNVSSLQNTRRGEILLFSSAAKLIRRRDAKIASLILVQ